MFISTKFASGDTVYRKYNNHILAHTVEMVKVMAVENTIVITYNLTRNLNTQYPSGGDLPDVQEYDILKDPE